MLARRSPMARIGLAACNELTVCYMSRHQTCHVRPCQSHSTTYTYYSYSYILFYTSACLVCAAFAGKVKVMRARLLALADRAAC
jgi:hypothetical protein